MSNTLVLIGFKSSGKTTVGRYFALKTHKHFIDTDMLVIDHYQKNFGKQLTCAEIYRTNGEGYFRDLEKKMIMRLDPEANTVIATGGGSVLDLDNVTRLKQQGMVVYLNASPDLLWARLNTQPMSPAIFDSGQLEANFISLYSQRDILYKELADVEIHVGDRSVAEIAEILGSL